MIINMIYVSTFIALFAFPACPPFMFKNTVSNTDMCQPCPAFSSTTKNDTGVAVCPCFLGFYRAVGEEAMRCTREEQMSSCEMGGPVFYFFQSRHPHLAILAFLMSQTPQRSSNGKQL